jgi:hypothetical protein
MKYVVTCEGRYLQEYTTAGTRWTLQVGEARTFDNRAAASTLAKWVGGKVEQTEGEEGRCPGAS